MFMNPKSTRKQVSSVFLVVVYYKTEKRAAVNEEQTLHIFILLKN